MIRGLKSRRPYAGYAFVAIVVSLICNFSYLLLLVTNQTDTGNRRAQRNRNKNVTTITCEGKLSVNGDGYGYIITCEGDSIYIVKIAQSCLAVCNSMDCSQPGPSVHGILQARILEW